MTRRAENLEDHYFPAPPGLARVQFLRSFNGSRDFEKRRPVLEYLAGAEDSQDYEITKPFSVAMWKGRIYVTDSFGLQALNVFDLEKRRFYLLGRTPGQGKLIKPINVFVDKEGFKYVSDLVRKQVVVYGPDDDFVRTYGDGTKFLPVACVANGKEVFILDIQKDRVASDNPESEWDEVRRDQILVLDKETGKPLRRIGKHDQGSEGFSFASFLTIDRLGNLYVSDFLNYRVIKMDAQGRVTAAFGEHGDGYGQFAQMKGIAVDRKGLIYVVDAAFQAVQVFDNGGNSLFPLGGPRAPVGPMDLPAGIWIDYENLHYFRDLIAPDFKAEYLILVANQLSSKHRVGVYAYGKREGLEYPSEDNIITLDRKRTRTLWRIPVFPPDVTQPSTQESPSLPERTDGTRSP